MSRFEERSKQSSLGEYDKYGQEPQTKAVWLHLKVHGLANTIVQDTMRRKKQREKK